MPRQTPHIVVLIPGITGSVLEKDGREIWAPSAGVALRALLGGAQLVKDLHLSRDSVDVEDIGDGVTATRLVPDVHLFPGLWKIDGYTKVASRLQQALGLEKDTNYFEFAYDWRRDNTIAAKRLKRLAAQWLQRRRQAYPTAKLILVAHSMGGLIARYFIEVLDGWRDTHALITFGTPYRGSSDALNSLSNGVRKLLHLIDLTELTRSFTSVYQLLPIYPCYVENGSGAIRLKEASKVPGVDLGRIAMADAFHRRIEGAVKEHTADPEYSRTRYAIHPIVGLEQPTQQSARLVNGRIEMHRNLNGVDNSGDGTVPRVSATPIEDGETRAVYAATRHASLQNADAVLTQLRGILTVPRALGTLRAAAPVTVSLQLEDVYSAGEPIAVAVAPSDSGEDVRAIVQDTETSATVATADVSRSNDQWRHVEFRPLPAGTYRIVVEGRADKVEPVSDLFLVA
jgi:pimeloyl-ACP methyl ester carboxylesterase